jgi:GntR family transcriptional regulator/MocR family aminotransferase
MPTGYDHYDGRMRRAAATFSPLIGVDRKAGRPLHAQIYAAIRGAIVARSLRGGERIPSTRALATQLGISRIPVLTAYSQLLAEGYFEARTGAGTFVSSSLPSVGLGAAAPQGNWGVASAWASEGHVQERVADGRPLGDAHSRVRSRVGARGRGKKPKQARQSRRMKTLPQHERPSWFGGTGAFSFSQPAVDAFPFHVWTRLMSRYWRGVHLSALEYGDPMGLPKLREAIAAYLRASRSVRCEWQQVMIVSGSQQALDVTARVLLDEGDPVWVEEPGYWLARNMLVSAGAKIVPVPVDGEGLNVAAGIASDKRNGRHARAAFVAPSHQFPMGATMSAARRMQLLEWAEREGAFIVEDDYDSEYRYDSKPIASLQGMDRAGRVIYIGTFSKVLFPAMRVGYIVVPPELVGTFTAVRHAMDVCPPHLFQSVLADFLGEGHFSRHIRKMRQIYGERRDVLVNCLREQCGRLLRVEGAEAGLHVTVTLARGFRDRAVCEAAALKKLWLWPLSPSYLNKGRARHGFILGFGGTTAAEIPAGVKRLREVLDGRAGA